MITLKQKLVNFAPLRQELETKVDVYLGLVSRHDDKYYLCRNRRVRTKNPFEIKADKEFTNAHLTSFVFKNREELMQFVEKQEFVEEAYLFHSPQELGAWLFQKK